MSQDLKWSITNGDLEQVRRSIEAGSPVNAEIGGRCPLHYAADFGQTEVVEYLLNKGAEVDARDSHGITPLLAAIWEGHAGAVKLLLARGASKDLKAPDGKSYVECAESEEIRKMLS